jgi:hypothetical protein
MVLNLNQFDIRSDVVLARKIEHSLGLGNDSLFDSRLFTRSTARIPALEGGEEGAAQ